MKRLASMQPYFFPYLGYWQLIAAVDCFELFDQAQYIDRGWVNRNRILKPGGGWSYIQVPVAKHPFTTAIRDVKIAPLPEWKTRIVNQLAEYRTKAPFFAETMELVESALFGGQEPTIGALNCRIVRQVCDALSIRSEIVASSDYDYDYGTIPDRGDRTLAMVQNMGASEFINPIDGISLLDPDKFARCGIKLSALKPPTIAYPQAGDRFEPALSIIDVMMFNGIAETSQLISASSIVPAINPLAPAFQLDCA
ncbi:WbqC family protein [Variovorax sp. OV700]|uniref:WbqC family protein n=1 Tax=Variovorax sp. OV700 TaxID=1882826 RepID=UPI0008912672|nr:WbqC family protein [Variovorax sp. OV700]SDI23349.1 WbqC-like protein family protein [Variovorax sp. OV700]